MRMYRVYMYGYVYSYTYIHSYIYNMYIYMCIYMHAYLSIVFAPANGRVTTIRRNQKGPHLVAV